ncbi:GPW/gp25 family protein [Leptolyngbya sp. AN02str]|uniref:GPW/gp25 family protein n=1 Tax=Leptolyngbya sp. AN02str TaxID=3423363 RepID=UPI003D31BDA4
MSDPATNHPDFAMLTAWWNNRLAVAVPIRPKQLWWQHKLGEIGAIAADGEDLQQAVTIILQTPRGSDVHRPEFASDLRDYVDYPVERATSFVVRDSVAAVELWEPRVDLQSVEILPYDSAIHQMTVALSWNVANSDIVGGTEVLVG